MSDPNAFMQATASSPELQAYYADKKLLANNLIWINVLNMGWGICFTIVSPLMLLHVNENGVHEGMIGTVGFVNSVLYSFLVMYFAWKSDHTVSRFGRRIPYLFISIPVIAGSVLLFPFFKTAWILILLWVLQSLFMDIKAATIPLLSIDCVPRNQMARWASVGMIVGNLVNWGALRYGIRLADVWDKLPYILTSLILILSVIGAALRIKEPPVPQLPKEKFRPWSAIQVACRDRRILLLMLGVGMISSFNLMYNSWIWLHAKNSLGLTRNDISDSLSWSFLIGTLTAYPVGWIIDRIGRKVVPLFWVITAGMFWLSLSISGKNDIALLALLLPIAGQLYGGVDMMVYRWCDPKDVGSITSTNSSLRQVYVGFLTLSSGYLIEWNGHNYRAAYILGFVLVSLAVVLFYLYWYLVDRKTVAAPQPPARILA